jgi:hypothetical protein
MSEYNVFGSSKIRAGNVVRETITLGELRTAARATAVCVLKQATKMA